MNVNKVILAGRLGADPETKTLGSGSEVCNFTIATSEKWKDKDGNKQERTEWHRCTAWGKLAEICGKYLSKGKLVYVEGSLKTRSWDDKDGNKRYATEIHITDMQMGPDADRQGGGRSEPERYSPPAGGDSYKTDGLDDDIPF